MLFTNVFYFIFVVVDWFPLWCYFHQIKRFSSTFDLFCDLQHWLIVQNTSVIFQNDLLSKTQVSYSKMTYCPKHKCHIPKWLTVQNASVKVLPQICRIWQRFIRILKLSLNDVPGWSPIVKPRNDLKFDDLYLRHSITIFWN